MKASLKFRDDQKPLFRAKVPLNILGFPFQSGMVAGESKELSMNIGTFFEAGPSFKISYRPNDGLNPFSFVFKTGIGHFGSPVSIAMNVSAEFSLIGGENPSFFVNFKPQLGDFTIKKSHSSLFKSQSKGIGFGSRSDEEGSVLVETPVRNNGGEKFTVRPLESSPAAGVVKGFLSDVEVSAMTAVPVRRHGLLNFRWGIRFPAEEASAKRSNNPTAGISFQKFPMLVMNKIGFENVAGDAPKESTNKLGVGPPLGGTDVAGACLEVKRQLELIQAENGMLRKAMDELKSDLVAAISGNVVKYREGERRERNSTGGNKTDRSNSNGDKKWSEVNGFGGKAMESEVNEELKKVLKG